METYIKSLPKYCFVELATKRKKKDVYKYVKWYKNRQGLLIIVVLQRGVQYKIHMSDIRLIKTRT